MKKKIIIALSLIVVVAAAAFTFILVKANALIALYKPKLEQTVSAALGAKVSLGEVTVSLFPSLIVNVASVSLTNEHGERLPVALGALRAEAAIMPLLSKRLELSTIEIVRPSFTVEKTAMGVSIPGLFGTRQTPPATKPAPTATSADPAAPSEAEGGLGIQIEEIAIRDGELLFNDKVAGRTLTIKAIQLSSGISLRGAETAVPEATLRFTLQDTPPLSVTAKNVSFNKETSLLSLGTVVLNSEAGAVEAQGEINAKSANGTVQLSSKGLTLTKLSALLAPLAPALSNLSPGGDLAFKVSVKEPTSPRPQLAGTVTLTAVTIAPAASAGVSPIGGTIALSGTPTDLNVKSDALAVTYQKAPLVLAVNAQVKPESLTVRSLEVKGFGGTTAITATLSQVGAKPFSATLSSATLSIESLLKSFKPELQQHVSGVITSLSVQPKGQLTGDIAGSVQAPGSLRVTNSVLKGTNLPNVILSKFDSIPFLEGSLRQFVPREFDRFLTSPDTNIKELTSSFTVQGRAISIQSFALSSDIFSLEGSGTIGADGAMSMNTTFFFTRDFSQALTQRNKNMKNILATDGRLIVPLSIRGKAPALVLYPDIAKIIETGAAKALQDKAVSALEKALEKGGKTNGLGKALGKTLGF